ncbi:Clavaminate synthase-like protein [Xylariaceae sp. FL0255]|nr:Clavaminate synthase-like protein [Xylariaceae sp. FL0255]
MGDFHDPGPVIAPPYSPVLPEPVFPSFQNSTQDGLKDLPGDFPPRLDHPSAWMRAEFANEASFVYSLSSVEQMELYQAKDEFKALELDGTLVDQTNFPLPTLGSKLRGIGHDIYCGKGFHVIRGLEPQDHSVEDLTIIWLGIQAYIADLRGRQDHRGNMLVHIVADNSSEIKVGHHRHSTSAISFHNEEAGDVISWFTRSTAASGGRCILAPVYTIYNTLATYRPDIIRVLSKSDWPVALPRFQCRPLMFYHESKLMVNFGRTPLFGSATHPRPEQLPRLNERQREALDVVEAMAQAMQLEIKTCGGDMHFVNNFTILHRREGFVDGAEPEGKRHLVRMRLRSSTMGWPIPASLQREWTDAFGENGCKTWHLEPMPGDAFPLRKYTN